MGTKRFKTGPKDSFSANCSKGFKCKNLNFFSTEERMTWISWMNMGVSKLSANVFKKVNYSFKLDFPNVALATFIF